MICLARKTDVFPAYEKTCSVLLIIYCVYVAFLLFLSTFSLAAKRLSIKMPQASLWLLVYCQYKL